ncbi:MAG: hypothetical protein A2816_00280 [Candidatus Yanofskybacteria bacterium RIFCSPHIGHO2_01_FULL_39_44]|nr:MAG: hypothetical protein A2816_00280 [Candidatus Yanofskybacteria bacterium RIFCSPHIGHO2_01_FULL_39_44]
MKRLFGISIFLCVVTISSGCVAKNEPTSTPLNTLTFAGEYEFQTVGLGAGHGFMFLPGVYPTSNLNYNYALPSGTFTFYTNNTFKINFGIKLYLSSPEPEDPITSFDEINGTYNITSKNTVTLRTNYGSSVYLYTLNKTSADDAKIIHLHLMPIHPWYPLKIGDYNSQQGSSIFDIIYLYREVD